jgi:dihydroorotase
VTRILLREVRLIDPLSRLDLLDCDLLLEDGFLVQVGAGLPLPAGAIPLHREGSVVAPCFLDLHCHLREPGQPWKERIDRATAAAAAGGFGAICAMANLVPPVDGVTRLREVRRATTALARLPVLQFAACTRGLQGQEPTELLGLAEAGAAAFSDDGRNGMGETLLAQVLAEAALADRTVAIHPEDESLLALVNPGGQDPGRWRVRPPSAEVSAIERALGALQAAPGSRLHLQHVSTAAGVELVRQAKAKGMAVTAEVTPHHLMLSGVSDQPGSAEPGRCNPPLRTDADRAALWEALLDGTIDALASDHAPHEIRPAEEGPPGFSGVQLVLSAVLGQGGASSHLARLVEALTAGPRRVLGQPAETAPGDAIRAGEPASLTWFDPNRSWIPGAQNWLSLGANTPFWGVHLRGAVLATFSRGRMVYLNRRLVPELADV